MKPAPFHEIGEAKVKPLRDDAAREALPVDKGRDDRRKGSEQDRDEAKASNGHSPRRTLIIAGIIGAIVLVAAIGYGWYYLATGRYMVATDDAYTQADNVAISAEVAGYIAELDVTDNQWVRKGDVIARIDDRTYRAALDQARADLAAAVANVHNIEAQTTLQQATITQAASDIGSVQAQLQLAEQDDARYSALAKTGNGTVQQAQQARSTLLTQRAALVKAEAALDSARKQLDVLQTEKEQADAGEQRASAAVAAAEVNLGYTTIIAPSDGVIGDRSAQLGLYVQPGTRLLTLVPMRDVYVVANYKETQLERMHQGQSVAIDVDTFPDLTIRGHIDSLAPGSGSQFSLLPPENATGNFTKIVQRIPVKIVLDGDEPMLGRLRPGLSVEPTVDTRDTKGKRLSERPVQNEAPQNDAQAPAALPPPPVPQRQGAQR